jgi:hypothetical protein
MALIGYDGVARLNPAAGKVDGNLQLYVLSTTLHERG